MKLAKVKNELKLRRKARVRAKIQGTVSVPRISVFRSDKHFYIQAINDQQGNTLISVRDKETTSKSRIEQAEALGKLLAKKLLEKNINQAVFDKGHYKYHGLVKAVAEGARAGGLKF